MTPTISILTPCYNARPYLPATWCSIKRQTFTDWEWIIWEDGSTDGSAEWLAELAARDSRVKVLMGERTKDPAAGRNRAAAHAKGKYLAFLDADDLWHPRKLQQQVQLLEANPKISITYCHIKEFWSKSSNQTTPPPTVWPRHPLPENALSTLLEKGNSVSPSTLLLRAECFPIIGPFTVGIAGLEDYEFICRAASKFSIRRTPGILAGYRMHLTNLSHNVARLSQGHETLMNCFQVNHLLTGKAGNRYRSIYHTRRAEYALEGISTNNPRVEFLKAIYWNPTSPRRWIPLLLLPVSRRNMLAAYTLLKKFQARLFQRSSTTHRFSTNWKSPK